MHLDAVPHRQRHRAVVDAALVTAHAVAVPEAVAAQPLALPFKVGPQRLPSLASIQIGGDGIRCTVARSQRGQLNGPPLQQVPLLHHSFLE